MSSIESNEWKNDTKQDPILSPHLIEKPLIGEDRYRDFDDLNPRNKASGFRWRLDSILALIILMIFLFIFFRYWIKWG